MLNMKRKLFCAAVVALFSLGITAHAQVIGSYDNFDCFNDTGETAEGFEIDVEDISAPDLTREFPSNFSTTPWVIRYGLPVVTTYDWTTTAPDLAHSYDAGHKGVLVTWAATWDGSQWIAKYGTQPFGAGVAGNGTPYVAKPTYTNGDSCWFYGLGAAYPTSGCDHFGVSFSPTATIGKISYHWKVPDSVRRGNLINSGLVASIPPSPVLAPLPLQPAVVQAVAEAPENPEPQFGPAYWVRVTTIYFQQDAVLDDLQKANIKHAKGKRTVSWGLLQRPPVGKKGERMETEDDAIPANYVQVTKQYEYWKFSGAISPATHEAFCGIVAVGLSGDCTAPYGKTYSVFDKESGQTITAKGDKGSYLGAHVNAYNLQ